MKKWIATSIIMLMIMILSGCMSQPEKNTIKATQPPLPEDPAPSSSPEKPAQSPEILALKEDLLQYWEIAISFSRQTNPNESFIFGTPLGSLQGQSALQYCYQQLIKLESIDSYLTNEAWGKYMPQYERPALNRTELLSKFSIVENVPLRVECVEYGVDEGHDTHYENYVVWHYNPDGTVNHLHGGVVNLPEYWYLRLHFLTDMKFEYNDEGIVNKIWIGELHDLNSSMDILYDEQGRLSGATDGEDSFFCSYDEKGHLTQVIYQVLLSNDNGVLSYGTHRMDLTYTFDNNGRIIQQTEVGESGDNLRTTNTLTFSYNDAGQMIEMDRMWEQWVDSADSPTPDSTMQNRYTFTYDEQGRLLTRTTYPGNRVDADGTVVYQGIKSKVETYIYGDQYIFGDYVIVYPEEKTAISP